MHTVIENQCTGCELCIPACPVDCISLVNVHPEPAPTGWAAWPQSKANDARQRHTFTLARRQKTKAEHDLALQAKAEHKLANLAELTKITEPQQLDAKRAAVEAALARARARRQGS
jgi:electron transport complex protein RnfB